MNKFQVVLTLATLAVVSAEPPVLSGGYGYRRPSSSHHLHTSIGHGFSSFGSGGHSFGTSGGGGYQAVHGGFQTNEGQYVDPILLHKVKEILLQHENLEASQRGHHHGISHGHGHGHGHISDTYGPPSSHYGPPLIDERIVGIELGHINPSIQVAQYHQAEHHSAPSISYGVPISIPSGSYGAPSFQSIPSGSYGVPSIPSGSYGAPAIHVPSGSYGAPAVALTVPSGSYGAPEH